MTTDSIIQQNVLAELEWEPSIDHADIGVAVNDGVVTLSGYVKSFLQKSAAERAASRVAGVKAIAEEIKVRFASDPKTADHEIAKRIVDMFKWDVGIPDTRLHVKVEQGWVTLTGNVDWHFQSEEARKVAGRITGVKGISNLITVKQSASAMNVRDRITAAFKRQAGFDAAGISVETDGGKVTLRGHVKAFRERAIAEQAAWAAPGVTRVQDDLLVSI